VCVCVFACVCVCTYLCAYLYFLLVHSKCFQCLSVRTQGAYVFIFESRILFFFLFEYLSSFPLLFLGFVILMLTFVSIT